MIIYIDTLIFTNIIADYILLSITSLVIKKNYKLKRIIPAAVLGGVSSLYIFVNSTSIIFDIIFKIGIGAIMILISCGVKKVKDFIFSFTIFLGLSFLLNGLVVFSQNLFGSNKLIIENLVSYINISPIFLIFATIVIYLAIRAIQRILSNKMDTESAELTVCLCGITSSFNALIDSGNKITDPFGDSQVFIIDINEFCKLTAIINEGEIQKRQRVVPFKTIDSKGVLNALRCDTAIIHTDGKQYSYCKPIIAASKEPIVGNFNSIISRASIERIPDNS